MAETVFKKGDVFRCAQGHGVVLNKQHVFLIAGEGGRSGWHHLKTVLPPDAVPDKLDGMHFEKRIALEAVQVAIS